MRAIQLMGLNRQLNLNKIPKPKINPGVNNVLVKVSYANINPSDIGYIFNLYGRYKHPFYPCNLGFEGSGIIEESNEKSHIGKNVIFWSNYEKSKYIRIFKY